MSAKTRDPEHLMKELADAVDPLLPKGAFAVLCVGRPVAGGYEALTVAVRCRDASAMKSFVEYCSTLLEDPAATRFTDEDRPGA